MKFKFSGTLLRFVDYQKELELTNVQTLHTAINQLLELHPDLRNIMIDGEGRVRKVIRVSVNRTVVDASSEGALKTALTSSDEVSLFTAIVGG
jgi:molybdopterin converting factor small subunit